MEANTYELKAILSGERRFLIPSFQRDYEWTEAEQWKLLFDDLAAKAGRLANARRHAEITGETLSKAEKRVAPLLPRRGRPRSAADETPANTTVAP